MTASGRLSELARLRLGSLALAGQILGFVALVIATLGMTVLSVALPGLLSSRVVGLLYVSLMFVLPVLGAWQAVRHEVGASGALAVSVASAFTPWAVFAWTSRSAVFGDPRNAVRFMALAWLVILPLATVLGAFLGSYVRRGRSEVIAVGAMLLLFVVGMSLLRASAPLVEDVQVPHVEKPTVE